MYEGSWEDYLDPSLLIVLPGLLLAAWAQWRVRRIFHKYSLVKAQCGLTAE
ncbi:MAG: zinc metallopeptidase [Oscillospiraceae bacterium]|jgi:Zn-dependent membrane protease YugP|nr:zinc metallopeptidase [Oscillospiraceae bacterium]